MMYLYRARSSDGRLLYVGLAKNWATRWAGHAAKAPWFREVQRLELESFANPDDAIAAEREVIESEHPLYNVRGGGGGVMSLDRRGLRCPICGAAYARLVTPLWVRGTDIPFAPVVDLGRVCGDQSATGDRPCPGILQSA